MYIRKKGRYYQIVETINGRQKVIIHLGTIGKILEMARFFKSVREENG